MFQSPSKEVFMGRAEVLDHLRRVATTKSEDVVRVSSREGGSGGKEDEPEAVEDMPIGRKVITDRGLSPTKVSGFFC